MTLFRNKYRIKSFRHPYWDYSSDGWYFITICTKNMAEHFGEVRNFIMRSSNIGCVTHEQWIKTGELRDNVFLDEFVVMPNHVHGIIHIYNPNVETHCNASLRNDDKWNNNQFGPQRNNLASIIRGFKSSVKRWCNQNKYPKFQWQSRFYDRIIRSEKELNEIRKYIYYNPQMWDKDRNNLKNKN